MRRKHHSGLFALLAALILCAASPRALAVGDGAFFDLLTDEERQYLSEADIIPTIISPNKGPIQYIADDGEQRGITVDVLEQISSLSGLTFQGIPLSGLAKIQEAIDNGRTLIVAGIPMERTLQDAYRVNFSNDYLTCSYGVILHRTNSLSDVSDRTLALATGLDVPEQFEDAKEIIRYATIQECISAVENHEADFSYGNAYVLEFYSQGYQLQNLCVIPLAGTEQNICFGVAQSADARLSSILDKAINFIGHKSLTNTLIRNVSYSTEPITLATLVSANPRVSILAGLGALFVIAMIAALLVRNSRLRGHRIRLEHQRYLLVSEAAKEYFYEYNCKADTMTFAEDAAELFGLKMVTRRWHGRFMQTEQSLRLDTRQLSRLYQAASSPEDRSFELQLPLGDGTLHWFRADRADIFDGGRLAYVTGKLRDVQTEYEERATLLEKSLCDSLTGIYHAASLKKFIDEALKKRSSGALFIIDLDYFKSVNDCFGHQEGDRVIKSVAAILREEFRRDDIVGRLGGDEFIVFTPAVSSAEFIEMKYERLHQRVGAIEISGSYCQTISVGVAQAQERATFDTLYGIADAALYYVKEHGRNGFHVSH